METTRRFAAVRAIALTLLVSGCSGGGCSNCAGGALGPIPGGLSLTPDPRVPRAVQVRVTSQGLDRIEAAGPDLLLGATGGHIPLPTLRGNFGVGRYIVCQQPRSGPARVCNLDIVLPTMPTPLDLSFRPPNLIDAHLRVGLRGDVPLHTCSLACNDDCQGVACLDADTTFPLDTARQAPPYLGLVTSVALRRDTHAERRGYLRADLVSPTGTGDAVQTAMNEAFSTDSVSCSGALCPLFPIIRPLLGSTFGGAIGGAVTPIRDALAHPSMPSPPGCPTGTRVDGNHCRYGDDDQVPTLLGAEVTGNLGALLQSFSAGVRANGTFGIAAGDPQHDAEVTAEGATLNLFGVAMSRGHNACVPRVPEPALVAVPEFPSLRTNRMPGTLRVPDLAAGVSETFLNHTLHQFWDAGMFCLGVTTALAPSQLHTGTFSIVIPSLRTAVHPAQTAPIAITLRPQTPPRLAVLTTRPTPTSPLLQLTFQRLALDFYLWSEERFVRAFTVTTDATIPIGLTDMMGLRPVLGTVATTNTTVTNNTLVSEAPVRLAMSLEGLLGFAFGMLGGNLPAITLPSIPIPGASGMPVGTVNVQLPADGIRGVEELGSRFLGVYADLRYTSMRRSIELPADTEATLVDATPAGRDAAVRVRVGPGVSLVPGAYEFAWRVDDLTWSHWTGDTTLTLTSPAFELPGAHRIEVVARRVGAPDSVDPEAAALEVTLAEAVAQSVTDAPPSSETTQLIRGGPSTDAGGGCGCRAGAPRTSSWRGLWIVALAAAKRRRRR